ncbi:MAG: PEP-CTERM sorting domain-containing protein [Phycisphaerae bacterium]|nr:PEP-CTERM sorting domain-containing protein [Phycisphaerae bacterium]
MKNGVGKKAYRTITVVAVFVAIVLVAPFVNANPIIDDMQISLLPTDWYDGSSQQFQLNYSGIPGFPAFVLFGIVSTTTSEDYDYMFDGSISITPATLLEDQSSGGWAKGKFAGGSIMTIQGNLFNLYTEEYVVTEDTILVAQMSSDPWYLEEMISPPAPVNKIRGSASFSTTGGKLFNGDNSEGLTLRDFRADFTFPGTTPAIANFGSTSYSSSDPSIQTVPEPASISLFCLAVLAVMRKRKM